MTQFTCFERVLFDLYALQRGERSSHQNNQSNVSRTTQKWQVIMSDDDDSESDTDDDEHKVSIETPSQLDGIRPRLLDNDVNDAHDNDVKLNSTALLIPLSLQRRVSVF